MKAAAESHFLFQRTLLDLIFVAVLTLVLPIPLLVSPEKTCPEGEFIHGEGCLKSCPKAYLNRTCVSECPPGTFSDKISPHRECTGCLAGTFASLNDSTICQPCQEGHYQVRN